jgi:hypothetical protein
MKKLLPAAMAAFFVIGSGMIPAVAGSDIDGVYQSLSNTAQRQSNERVVGKQMFAGSGDATSVTMDVFDFGFKSNFVKLCVEAGATVNTPAYFQLGSNQDVSISEIFIKGPDSSNNPTVYSGRAMPITGGGDGTDQFCTTQSWRTTALTMHSIAAGTITVDVWAW